MGHGQQHLHETGPAAFMGMVLWIEDLQYMAGVLHVFVSIECS